MTTLTAQQLRQFCNECVALRHALEKGEELTEVETRLVRSQILHLLTELDGCREQILATRAQPRQERAAPGPGR